MTNSETPHSYDLDFKTKYLDFLTYYFKLDKEEWQAYQIYKQAKQESEVVDGFDAAGNHRGDSRA